MAEQEGAAAGGKNFLTHKLGPLPVGVWLVIFGGLYFYMKRRNTKGATGASRDPAGNVGTIDPATGYVYGSSQDASALGAQSSTGASGTVSGTGGSTVGGQYQTNDAWVRAAINYLVGVGVDPTEANSAITTFMASQPLTPQQQGEVNLAIQNLGAPPQPPAPGTTPGPIVSPPGGGPVTAANPVSGLRVREVTANSARAAWNRSANASAYAVSWTGQSGSGSQTVSGTAGSATLTGLSAGTRYTVTVQATPAKSGDPSASTSFTTSQAETNPEPVPLPGPSRTPVTAQDLGLAEPGGNPSFGIGP